VGVEPHLYEDLYHQSNRSSVDGGAKAFDNPAFLQLLKSAGAGCGGQADHLGEVRYRNAPIILKHLQHLNFEFI
jgi:hypothetical protein